MGLKSRGITRGYPWLSRYFGRIAARARAQKNGYDCLVLWEHELNNEEDVLRKLEVFLYA